MVMRPTHGFDRLREAMRAYQERLIEEAFITGRMDKPFPDVEVRFRTDDELRAAFGRRPNPEPFVSPGPARGVLDYSIAAIRARADRHLVDDHA